MAQGCIIPNRQPDSSVGLQSHRGPQVLYILDTERASEEGCLCLNVPIPLYQTIIGPSRGSTMALSNSRFAGNMIIFPHGDWYGCINQPQDAAAVVDAVHHQSSLEHDDNLPSVGVRHMWRGRMGMSNEQYARLKEDL